MVFMQNLGGKQSVLWGIGKKRMRLFLGPSGADRKIPCRRTGCRTHLHGLGYGPLLIYYCESYEN